MLNNITVANITRPYELITFANTATNSMFGVVVVIATFIIAFMAMKDYPTKAATSAAIFISTLIAILLRIMGALADWVVFTCIIATVASVAFLIFGGEWK